MRSESASLARSASKKPDAVLLVDDEAGLLEAFAESLAPHFEIAKATTTRDADTLLARKRYKVVIADYLMPGENGLKFLIRCRERHPHMQRILLTGFLKPDALLNGVNEAGLFRYLLKPVQLPDLVSVVQEAVRAADTNSVSGPG